MVYRVYISSPNQDYNLTVQRALLSMDEYPVSLLQLETEQNRLMMARKLIGDADIFIVVLGMTYGVVPQGYTQSYTELEYEYAQGLGKMCLIFAPDTIPNTDDPRQGAFLNHLLRNHVVTYFADDDELAAQVKLATSKSKKNRGFVRPVADRFHAQTDDERRVMPPASSGFRDETPPLPPADDTNSDDSKPIYNIGSIKGNVGPSGIYKDRERRRLQPLEPADTNDDEAEELATQEMPPAPDMTQETPVPTLEVTQEMTTAPPLITQETPILDDNFDAVINRAIELAQDDIEGIIRRALELHEAQNIMQKKAQQAQIAAMDGLIEVRPIWGEPQHHSQFQSDIFMIMPFRQQFNEIYSEMIRPLTAELNLTIKRGDEFRTTGNFIMQEVWGALNACRLVIAEMSLPNPNVYYELGIAHTLGKPVIMLTQSSEITDIPFDIRHLRFIVYENSIMGARELEAELKRSIIWTLNDLDEQTH